jgi:hypothetical protein
MVFICFLKKSMVIISLKIGKQNKCLKNSNTFKHLAIKKNQKNFSPGISRAPDTPFLARDWPLYRLR